MGPEAPKHSTNVIKIVQKSYLFKKNKYINIIRWYDRIIYNRIIIKYIGRYGKGPEILKKSPFVLKPQRVWQRDGQGETAGAESSVLGD